MLKEIMERKENLKFKSAVLYLASSETSDIKGITKLCKDINYIKENRKNGYVEYHITTDTYGEGVLILYNDTYKHLLEVVVLENHTMNLARMDSVLSMNELTFLDFIGYDKVHDGNGEELRAKIKNNNLVFAVFEDQDKKLSYERIDNPNDIVLHDFDAQFGSCWYY